MGFESLTGSVEKEKRRTGMGKSWLAVPEQSAEHLISARSTTFAPLLG